MALFTTGSKARGARRATVALTALAAAIAIPAAAMADAPDAIWNAPWVLVAGDAPASVLNEVNVGLRRAGETYFYGDRATKMIATIRGEGLVDVKIIDAATGEVLASGPGLRFGPGGDVGDAMARAALGWMDGLSCGGGCAVAEASMPAAPVPAADTVAQTAADDAATDAASAGAETMAVAAASATPEAPETPGTETPAPETPAAAAPVAPDLSEPTVDLATAAPRAAAPRVADPSAPTAGATDEVPRVAAAPVADTGPAGDSALAAAVAGEAPEAPEAPAVTATAPAAPETPETPEVAVATAPADAATPSTPEVHVVSPSVVPPLPRPEAPESPVVAATGSAPADVSPAPATGPSIAALATPADTAPADTAPAEDVRLVAPTAPETPAADTTPEATAAPADRVETRVAAVDPTAEGPTLANARWIGFSPAVFTGGDTRAGLWISGPFDRKQRVGWITDTATGATSRVTFVWREGGRGGRTAILSGEAAKALGLRRGDVANVAVYLPR